MLIYTLCHYEKLIVGFFPMDAKINFGLKKTSYFSYIFDLLVRRFILLNYLHLFY